jgi:DNA mismatch endonuclease (patch repair protein)
MSTKSEQMARVRSRDTAPERLVRALLTARGVRYRLHRKDLPGRPDVYVPRLRLALFVNGCFWHGHACPRGRLPATNVSFWHPKIARTVERDARAIAALAERDIAAQVLWTCEEPAFAAVADAIAVRYRASAPPRATSASTLRPNAAKRGSVV